MEPNEPVILIAQPVATAVEIIDGSKQHDCTNCGEKVWVSPSGQGLIEEGAMLVCLPCGKELSEKHKVPPQFIPEALGEILRHLAKKRRD